MPPVSTIEVGALKAKIYRTRKSPALFTLVWKEADGRRRKNFASLEKAEAAGNTILGHLSEGMPELAEVPLDKLRYYQQCEKLAADGGTSLWQAVQDGLAFKKQSGSLSPATAAALMEQLLVSREQDGVTSEYLRVMRVVLTPFASFFKGSIHEIAGPEIDEWLRKSHKGPRTRKNVLRSIRTLFAFAKAKNALLPDRPTEAERVAMPKVTTSASVEIFTVDEMKRLLQAATPEGKRTRHILPVLVLGGFCGIRTDGEIQRISWEDVREDQVIVEKQKLRGAGRRYVPLPANARAWLELCPNRRGLVWREGMNVGSAIRELAKLAKVEWKRNALRHSFISYRVAETQNAPQVALEAGNSVTMIHKHYRELVTKEQAAEWFGIKPLF